MLGGIVKRSILSFFSFIFTERDNKIEFRLQWDRPFKGFVSQICEGAPRRTDWGTHDHRWREDNLCQHRSLQVSHQT